MASAPGQLSDEIQDLRAYVQEYRPGKTVTIPDKVDFPESLFIGLFGKTGCGKSSLINSLKYATQGRLRRAQWVEVASQEKAGGHTMFRKIANLTQTIFVIDNRGLDSPNVEQARAEIAAQLDGRRGYSERVQWLCPAEEGHQVESPSIDLKTGHPISCAIFVFSAIHDVASNVSGLNEVIDFLHSHQGRYPVAVITHVDVAEQKTVDTLATVLRVAGVSDIYEVANITPTKMRLEEQYQLNLLTLIERCMTVGDETVVFKHYQRVELEKKMQIQKLREQAADEKRKAALTDASPISTSGSGERAEANRPDVQSNREQAESNGSQQNLEEERKEVDQLKMELERRKIELEFLEKERILQMDLERQQREMEAERRKIEQREKELQDNERQRRFEEALQKAEAEKHRELMRIMEANRSQHHGHTPLIGCKLQ